MGSCAAPSVKGDDKFITTDYLQQCHAPSINKPQRSLNEEDMLEAIIKLQGSSEAIFGKR
ncbi:TPA: hypothetical protein JLJ67_004702 [Escherichia coli]|nr:hypothetical protein [Escherichia coli]HAW0523638.1 hypothetical protein [Escherichia coli]HAW6365133.1 hypothetical protein [Escherichia coli]